MKRVKGIVNWFNGAKGYGFIGCDNGPEVFVHHTAIIAEGYKILEQGEWVEFEVVGRDKDLQAINVTKLSGSPVPATARGTQQ